MAINNFLTQFKVRFILRDLKLLQMATLYEKYSPGHGRNASRIFKNRLLKSACQFNTKFCMFPTNYVLKMNENLN